ncbi:single-stranded DNA-binding protein [Streptomyces gamaensis]|uniref:Single-stranded DNA-binding protein n=1 Tax=Streptomyces gamaensis TaxID=1763542 RepID=A0ABW0Z855_9ACTN
MALGETPITIVGNLTADPDLSFTKTGQALAKFTVASTPRTFDKDTGQWRDGNSTFFRCTAWRSLAEHVAESLVKGSRVVLSGRIRQHDWQTPEGENRSMLAVEVDDIGASLRFTTVQINGKRTNGTTPPDNPWNTADNPAEPGNEPPF